MSIVTQLPIVLAQTRAFISGRSKGTWHGDLCTYANRVEGDGGKGEVGGNTGGCVGIFTKPMRSLGLNIWSGYNEW